MSVKNSLLILFMVLRLATNIDSQFTKDFTRKHQHTRTKNGNFVNNSKIDEILNMQRNRHNNNQSMKNQSNSRMMDLVERKSRYPNYPHPDDQSMKNQSNSRMMDLVERKSRYPNYPHPDDQSMKNQSNSRMMDLVEKKSRYPNYPHPDDQSMKNQSNSRMMDLVEKKSRYPNYPHPDDQSMKNQSNSRMMDLVERKSRYPNYPHPDDQSMKNQSNSRRMDLVERKSRYPNYLCNGNQSMKNPDNSRRMGFGDRELSQQKEPCKIDRKLKRTNFMNFLKSRWLRTNDYPRKMEMEEENNEKVPWFRHFLLSTATGDGYEGQKKNSSLNNWKCKQNWCRSSGRITKCVRHQQNYEKPGLQKWMVKSKKALITIQRIFNISGKNNLSAARVMKMIYNLTCDNFGSIINSRKIQLESNSLSLLGNMKIKRCHRLHLRNKYRNQLKEGILNTDAHLATGLFLILSKQEWDKIDEENMTKILLAAIDMRDFTESKYNTIFSFAMKKLKENFKKCPKVLKDNIFKLFEWLPQSRSVYIENILNKCRVDQKFISQLENATLTKYQVHKIVKKAMHDMQVTKENMEDFILNLTENILGKMGIDNITNISQKKAKQMLHRLIKKQDIKDNSNWRMGRRSKGQLSWRVGRRSKGHLSWRMGRGRNGQSKLINTLIQKVISGDILDEDWKLYLNSSVLNDFPFSTLKTIKPNIMCQFIRKMAKTLTGSKNEKVFRKCYKQVKSLIQTDPASLGMLMSSVRPHDLKKLDITSVLNFTKAACQREIILNYKLERLLLKYVITYLKSSPNKATEEEFLENVKCTLKYREFSKYVDWENANSTTYCILVGKSYLKRVRGDYLKEIKSRCLQLLLKYKISLHYLQKLLSYVTEKDINSLTPHIVFHTSSSLQYYAKPELSKVIGSKIKMELDKRDKTKMNNLITLQPAGIYLAALNATDREEISMTLIRMLPLLIKISDKLLKRQAECKIKHYQNCTENNLDLSRVLLNEIWNIKLKNHLNDENDDDTEIGDEKIRKRSVDEASQQCFTCENLKSMKATLTLLNSTLLDMICQKIFEECADIFDNVGKHSKMLRKKVKELALQSWGGTSNWTQENLQQVPSLIAAMPFSDIKNLKLSSLDFVTELGNSVSLPKEKLQAMLYAYFKQGSVNLSSIDSATLLQLKNLICGLSNTDIAKIPSNVFINSLKTISSLTCLDADQLNLWALKVIEIFGNIRDWETMQVSDLRLLINGLPVDVLRNLTREQIEDMPESFIPLINGSTLANLSPEQIGYFTSVQAALILESHLNQLPEKYKSILMNKDSDDNDTMFNSKDNPEHGDEDIDNLLVIQKSNRSQIQHNSDSKMESTSKNFSPEHDSSAEKNGRGKLDNKKRTTGQRKPDKERTTGQRKPDKERTTGQRKPDKERTTGQREPDKERTTGQRKPDKERTTGQRKPDKKLTIGRQKPKLKSIENKIRFPFRNIRKEKIDVLLDFLQKTYNRVPSAWKARILNIKMHILRVLVRNSTALEIYSSGKWKNLLISMSVNTKFEKQIMDHIKIDDLTAINIVEGREVNQNAVKFANNIQKLLSKAMKDMKIMKDKLNEFVQKVPPEMMQNAGINMIIKMFNPQTKDEIINKFRSEKTSETDEYENSEVEDTLKPVATAALTELTVVKLVFSDKSTDKKTMSKLLTSKLVFTLPASKLKSLSIDLLCNDSSRPRNNLAPIQRKLIFRKCWSMIKKDIQKNPKKLGEIITALSPKELENFDVLSLKLLTTAACRFDRLLSIELEVELFKKLKNYLVENKDALENMSFIRAAGCILKHGGSLLENVHLSTKAQKQICRTVGRNSLNKISSDVVTFWRTKCLSLVTNRIIPLKNLKKLLGTLTTKELAQLNVTEIENAARELSIWVTDQKTNREIGKRLRKERTKNPETMTDDDLRHYYTYITMWPPSEIKKIPKEAIINVSSSWFSAMKIMKRRMKICMKRGGKENICKGNTDMIPDMYAIVVNVASTGKRKKRSLIHRLKRQITDNSDTCSATITCEQIQMNSGAAEYIDIMALSKLCKDDFENCAGDFGSTFDLSSDRKKIIMDLAKKYWGPLKTWSTEKLTQIAGSITGLTAAEIKTLKINSLTLANLLGKLEDWTEEKLMASFKSWLNSSKANNLSAITDLDLQAIGNLACGATASEIAEIPIDSYISAARLIGGLEFCQLSQLVEWAKKAISNYGDNIENWDPSILAELGSVISGLPEKNLKRLTKDQISTIPYSVIPLIKSESLLKLSDEQLKFFTETQVAWISIQQYEGLTEKQRNILKEKTQLISDKTKNTEDINNSGNAVRPSVLMGLLSMMVSGTVWMTY